jgi:hypothetical protein
MIGRSRRGRFRILGAHSSGGTVRLQRGAEIGALIISRETRIRTVYRRKKAAA